MKVRAIRGMPDILPNQQPEWDLAQKTIHQTLSQYGYEQIQLPIVEKTELFKRSIGDETDIVTKEMYTFEDRNGDSLTLRPEGTASCVRAAIEHGLTHTPNTRLWYQGPMFRHERPQKGRYRQFNQIGIEVFGIPESAIDAEILLMTHRILKNQLALPCELNLNYLGNQTERQSYIKELSIFLKDNVTKLDEDSQNRLEKNPLRILDSKNPDTQTLLKSGPTIETHLTEESLQTITHIKDTLKSCNIDFQWNPRIVRGLDYYNGLVFEWITNELGAQGTICAGGRYDQLVTQLGGKDTPAIGAAIGMERVTSLLATKDIPQKPIDIYLITLGKQAQTLGLQLTESLRENNPTLNIINHCNNNSVKSQLRQADKSQAKLALILGEDEIKQKYVMIKPLQQQGEQQSVPLAECEKAIQALLKK